MQGIFINYRREDAEGYAITLQNHLAKHFGTTQLSIDVGNIAPGINIITAIENSLASCKVMLVLIGARWLNATDEQGHRQLNNPHDPLRIEIESALNNQLHLIPVLIHDTPMPSTDALPESLAPLAHCDAIKISSNHQADDLQHLISILEKIPGIEPLIQHSSTTTQPTQTHTPAAPRSNAIKHGLFGGGAILLLLVTLALFDSSEENSNPEPTELAISQNNLSEIQQPQATKPPATKIAQTPPQPQAANVDLTGTWYDDSGTRFEATQKGDRFIAAGFNRFGMATKQIHGTVQGNTLTFTLQDGFIETAGSGTLNADGQHFDYLLKDGNFSETGQLHLNHTRN